MLKVARYVLRTRYALRCEKRDPSHTLRMTGNSLPLEGKVDCEARRMRWHFTNLFFTDTLCPTPHHRLRQSLSSPETATLLSLRDIFPIREIASRRSLSFSVILRESIDRRISRYELNECMYQIKKFYSFALTKKPSQNIWLGFLLFIQFTTYRAFL